MQNCLLLYSIYKYTGADIILLDNGNPSLFVHFLSFRVLLKWERRRISAEAPRLGNAVQKRVAQS